MTTPARIAIVDDDAAFAQYLAVMLGTRGYEVSVFQSGTALLHALDTSRPPDVVLLDVLMPGMDGLETLRAARTRHPALQVLMLSGNQVPATIVDAVRLGAIDYVVKPDDPEGLGEAALELAIRNAIERQALTSEVARLRAQAAEDPDGTQPCWGAGTQMLRVLTMVERVADSDVNVLITGESGVGKEIVAHQLHRRSARRAHPFVKVNCAALPADLLESELFGHERGAFTGAQVSRAGKFEFAAAGTIMLDEIGEMPLALQAKLLHVLQDHQFTRIGSNCPVDTDVRVLAATNRELDQMIRAGTFREDLYYRLQVIEIRVPPLRERRDEILPLAEFFLLRYSAHYGRKTESLSRRLRDALVTNDWPGNVRELENVIKRFVILRDENLVLAQLQRKRPAGPREINDDAMAAAEPAAGAATPQLMDTAPGPEAEAPERLPDVARRAAVNAERAAIQQALDRARWNRRKAAQQLGVSYKTLLNKMKECGIGTPAG